jgi:hypothetical protein
MARVDGDRLLSLEPEESPGHQGYDARRWHLVAAHCLNGDTGTSRFRGSSLTVQPSDLFLYQTRRSSERSRAIILAFPHRHESLQSERGTRRRVYGIFIIPDSYEPEASPQLAATLLIGLEIEPVT